MQEKTITKGDFFFSIPLYKTINFADLTQSIYSGDVDGYNNLNKYETTFSISYQFVADYGHLKDYRAITLECKRNRNAKYVYFIWDFTLEDGKRYVTKVGQLPSMADISQMEIDQKYESVIDDANLTLFKKGIGLAAHGVGAGSFVYLRKIFEDLIAKTYEDNQAHISGITQADFEKLRMSEKIEKIKDLLPPQLVQMKSIYKILSKGVHKLSESDCLRYFPALKLSIELIWDAQIEAAEKINRTKLAEKELQRISQELGTSPGNAQ